ncbi:xanthine dehydrogenase accessory protein XdhC [Acidisoma cellulosilytica]|uniref:Xanthine dehydrogenase accessory protein XdhC n=1 Tax=Acidisoma cellulosilyticum TaxID=2802395 RepID=A0A963YYE3_9PROT|nr:xanthine dehydrogenase accessory protein XdhC [Acidisoma cellulosilyticum]MCB8879131.1 xanthine dehydrogenase accessory protein XdhC [Acidisoma cellulosilyticum]
MPAWLDALSALDSQGEAAVLVSIIRAQGSAPREAGVKMVVSASSVWDTIGGGNLEFQSIQDSRTLLASGARTPVTRDFPLGPALGQCCGGATTVLFEPIRPPSWTVAIFGAGHVGRAVAKLLGDLPCRLLWFDSRADVLQTMPVPGNTRARTTAMASDIAALPAGTAVLIMTHDHGLDFDLTEAALRRPDLSFIGTIGSETKRARFVSRLRKAGLDEATLGLLCCPVGLPDVGSKLPAEIAISVVAQLLQRRPVQTMLPVDDDKSPADPPPLRNSGCGKAGCDAGCGPATAA